MKEHGLDVERWIKRISPFQIVFAYFRQEWSITHQLFGEKLPIAVTFGFTSIQNEKAKPKRRNLASADRISGASIAELPGV